MKIQDKAPLPIEAKKIDRDLIPDRFKDIAGSMEQQFAELMLEEMKKTVNKEEPETNAETYYNSLLQQEYAKNLTNGDDGMGLKKMILNQIYPQHLRNEINYHRFQNDLAKSKVSMKQEEDAKVSMKGKE